MRLKIHPLISAFYSTTCQESLMTQKDTINSDSLCSWISCGMDLCCFCRVCTFCTFYSVMFRNQSITQTTAYLNWNKTGKLNQQALLTQFKQPVKQAGCDLSALLAELAVLHHGLEDVPHFPGLPLN